MESSPLVFLQDAPKGTVLLPLAIPVDAAIPSQAAPVQEGDVFGAVLRWQRTLAVSERCNESTRRQYRGALFRFLSDVMADPGWEGERDPFVLTEDDVIAYLSGIDPRGGASSMTVRALRSFYGWMADREDAAGVPLIARNPMRHIHPKAKKYGPAPSLSRAELTHVLRCAEQVDPRARWAIQLQYATACRAGSLVEVKPSDVEQTDAGLLIHFTVAKNDDPYAVPLGPKGAEAVAELVKLLDYKPKRVNVRRATLLGVGYTQYENWVKRTEGLSGIHLHSHLLRHTAITRMSEDPSIPVRTIMSMANWRDPGLLDRYAAKSDQHMRAAAEGL